MGRLSIILQRERYLMKHALLRVTSNIGLDVQILWHTFLTVTPAAAVLRDTSFLLVGVVANLVWGSYSFSPFVLLP